MSRLYEQMERELQVLREQGRLRTLPVIGRRDGIWQEFDGRRLLNLSSNDYLGIGSRSSLRRAYLQQCGHHGARCSMTSSSSRLLTGNHELYTRLEDRLAALYQREAALVFNSGYHANTGILPALATRRDLVLSDKLNHASILDGGRIAAAEFRRYRHGDYDHLESLLARAEGRYRQLFIVSESVFSMDGDCADLGRLVELKERYGAILIVDEAHGAGTFGRHGLGLAEASGVIGSIDVLIGTFGKAFASTGAYAVMDGIVKEYLVNTMRTLIFTTALPPVVLGWSLQVLEAQLGMQEERLHLQRLADRLRAELRARGFGVIGESHIVPVIVGTDERAVSMALKLREQGVLALPVRPPTVPEQTARLRFSLRADLCWEDLEAVVHHFDGGVL